MKKLLTIAALASVASLSYGQGFVEWFNAAGSRTSINTAPYGETGGTVSLTAASTGGAPLYYFGLFVAPSTATTIGVSPIGDPTTTGWTFTGNYATNASGLFGGRLSGVSSAGDGIGIQIPGYPVGTTASFAIVGWSANLGTTWAAIQPQVDSGDWLGTGYYGVDQSVATGVPLAPYLAPYNNVMGTPPLAGGFTMYAVPEPSTFALAGLGAALVFRRRKSGA